MNAKHCFKPLGEQTAEAAIGALLKFYGKPARIGIIAGQWTVQFAGRGTGANQFAVETGATLGEALGKHLERMR